MVNTRNNSLEVPIDASAMLVDSKEENGVEATVKRFGFVNEDPMAELKNLRYETSMKEYQSQFEMLLNQVDITESQSISMFIVGLPASIALNTTSGWNANNSVSYPPKNTTTTLALPTPNAHTVNKFSANLVSALKRLLSQKEFVEKRAKNQFFYYDKKYVTGHKCDGQYLTNNNHEVERPRGWGWLSTLGTIQWNFKVLTMQFYYEGPKVVLRETHQSELAWLIGKQMSKLVSQTGKDQISSICCFGQSATLNLMQCGNDQSSLMNADSHQLLEECADGFDVPKELPPQRSFDHRIPLKE
ncbi:hypothetical protein Tco_1411892 [Tanacetum coccineum]